MAVREVAAAFPPCGGFGCCERRALLLPPAQHSSECATSASPDVTPGLPAAAAEGRGPHFF